MRVSLALAFAGLLASGAMRLAQGQSAGTPAAPGASRQLACASASFANAMNIDTGLFASGVALGDFNSDGTVDMAVSNQNANNVSILLGDGRGGFGQKVDVPLGGPPQRIETADLNRDGHADLILPIQASSTVAILFGDGKGGFGNQVTIPVDTPFMPAVGDFDANGTLDLAVTVRPPAAAGRPARIAVLLAGTPGVFGAPRYYDASAGPPLGVADFNRDGRLDLATAGATSPPAPGSGRMSILLGDGAGGFGMPAYFGVGASPQSMSIADFNGDGFLDVAISSDLPAGTNSTVSVLLGKGDGTFAPQTAYEIGEAGRGTGVADFNGDGKLDLVVANSASNSVSVLLGDGKGGFGPKRDVAVGTAPRKLAVGDVNRDGRPDIIVPNTRSNNVSVLLNTCAP